MPVVLAYLTCALVWGTTWHVIRICTGPGGYPTLEAAALRFVLATVVLAPVVVALKLGPWPRGRRAWAWIVVAGGLDALSYALVYLGEERVPGGLAAVLFATQPLMLAALLTVTGSERVGRLDLLGAVIALAGVAVIFADRWQVSPRQGVGLVMVLAAVAASTAYSYILKREAQGVHALVSTLLFLAVTSVGLALAVAVRGPQPLPWPLPFGPTAALVYLAVLGSIVTFAAWLWLLQRLSLMATSSLVFVLPVVALFVDAIWEREVRVGLRTYLGSVVVFAGLAVALFAGRGRRRVV
ncbi:MAG: DMT family transporter [Kofleriaceae bacterium]